MGATVPVPAVVIFPSFDRNEQHRAALEHHPTNAECPGPKVRSGICLHLLIAGSLFRSDGKEAMQNRAEIRPSSGRQTSGTSEIRRELLRCISPARWLFAR